jgi:nuclear transport factor 2 (NTF2) superfamily protein
MKEFATRYTAAWNSQEPAQVAACYSPEGSLTVNQGTPAVGRAAIAAVARSFMDTFPDLHLTMGNLLPRNGRIQFHWTLQGTNLGRRVKISGFEEWTISPAGLIDESQGHFDAADYNRQLGAPQ